MSGYPVAFVKAIFRHNLVWWSTLLVAYVLQIGFWSEYASLREHINAWAGRALVPEHIPLWLLVLMFLLWVIASFAHDAALRHLHSARIEFDPPHRGFSPLFAGGAQLPDSEFWGVKVNVYNRPYSMHHGRDVEAAWGEVEVMDLGRRTIRKWQFPRWEENKQPGYSDTVPDYYPDEQKMRTLIANGRPNSLCIALKPQHGHYAYPFRGEDQLKPGWRDENMRIPPGDYLVRITIRGKGLENPAIKVFEMQHRGVGSELTLTDTPTAQLFQPEIAA